MKPVHYMWVRHPRKIVRHLLLSVTLGIFFILLVLGLGMLGYHFFEGMSFSDAFVNAAMILSGMGPLDPLLTKGGRLFAGWYALFSGLIFLLIIGLMFAPLIHLFLHKINLPDDKEEE